MTASRRPTDAPLLRRAAARLTATVDLPTPPLPEATAIVCLTPGKISEGFGRMKAGRTLAVIRTSTAVTPGISPTRSCACDLKRSRTGQAGVVSSNVKLTLPCGLTSSSLIIPRLTTSRPRSGSWMWDSTSRTWCEEGTAIVRACYRDSNAPDFEPLTPEKRNRGTPIDPVGAKRTESPLVKDTVGASGAESRLGNSFRSRRISGGAHPNFWLPTPKPTHRTGAELTGDSGRRQPCL